MEIGIALDPSTLAPDDVVALARRADDRGIDIVAVDTAPASSPWALATWLAGVTSRIRLAVDLALADDPADAGGMNPQVVEKSRLSLEALAPDRLLRGAVALSRVAAGADDSAVRESARHGIPVVPVTSIEAVDRVAAQRAVVADLPAPRPQRSRDALSRRAPGIAYDDVPASLAATAVEPGDAEHHSVASTYLRGGDPGLVLRPRTVEQVADALAFARTHRHVPLGIRSAGHGVSGRSTNRGGVVIDVGALRGIEILDEQTRRVRIGPGATWKRVAQALAPRGWALGSGDYGGVGVGGLATAGGIGFLSRKHGLTIDHVRAVDLVLADGSPVRASETENPDLFWAVRGAGANFGVATSFEFEASEVGLVGWAQLVLVTDDIEASLLRYGELAANAPRDTTVFLVTGRPREGRFVIQLFAVVDHPDPDVVVSRLQPFTELGLLAQQNVVMTTYDGVMANAHDVGPEGQQGFGEPVSRSAFVPALTPEFAADTAALLRSGLVFFFELRAMGGAIADVDPGAMAFPHRSPLFQAVAMSGDDETLTERWRRLRHHFDGLYLSFETGRSPDLLVEAFTEPGLDRLRQLKRRYDPTTLFRDNFTIAPAVSPTAGLEDPHD